MAKRLQKYEKGINVSQQKNVVKEIVSLKLKFFFHFVRFHNFTCLPTIVPTKGTPINGNMGQELKFQVYESSI